METYKMLNRISLFDMQVPLHRLQLSSIRINLIDPTLSVPLSFKHVIHSHDIAP